MRLDDTIAAPITGLGKAAVCVVRISGESAWKVTECVFTPFPTHPESHRVYYGRAAEMDDGLLTLFEEGRSYTGQQTAEIGIHGSPASVRHLLETLGKSGARMAEPGEFTYRAFANGRLDLSQAESVRDTVEAETLDQLRLAHAQRGGALREQIEELRESATRILAEVEAHVDFSEELGDPDEESWIHRIDAMTAKIDRLLETAESGRIMRSGLRVILLGQPNAGKSSLLNALLGSDRAIVSPIPGTTRDYIEEKADLGGVPCVLIDTAGLRTSLDDIEAEGVARSRDLVNSADLILYLFDPIVGWNGEDERELANLPGERTRVVATKRDLGSALSGLAVSSLTREGLSELIAEIRGFVPSTGQSVAISPRHAEALDRAKQGLDLAHRSLRNSLPHDLVSTAMRECIHELGTITGQSASADMIDRIFGEFCIGK